MVRWSAQNNKWKRRTAVGSATITPIKPVMGAATGSPSSTTFSAMEAQVGTLLARRSYNSTFSTNFMTTEAAIDVAANRWSIYSFKISPGTTAAGTNDAALTSFLGTIPAGHKTTLVMWHEPEDNIANGDFTLADWQNAQIRLADLVLATGRSELSVGICLMGYTFKSASGRNPDDYWPSGFDGKINYIGIDAYQSYNFLGGTSWTEWAAEQATFTPWITSKGVPGMLMEYASAEYPGQVMRKANWLASVYDWAKNNNFAALCYFNLADGVGMNSSHLITSSSQAQTEFTNEVTDSKL